MSKPIITSPAVILAGFLAIASAASAANIYKANNSDALNVATSWTNNAVPGASDTAIWDANVTETISNDLGTGMTWGGLEILNPGGPVTIGADGNTLTNQNGINMSQATQGLTLNNNVLAATPQAWQVYSNQTLTLNGALTRSLGSLLRFNFDSSTAQTVLLPGVTGSIVTANSQLLGYTAIYPFATFNDMDYAALNGNNQVVAGATLGTYVGNPNGAAPSIISGTTAIYDINNTNSYGVRVANNDVVGGFRFNMPQTATGGASVFIYNGLPAWDVLIKNSTVLTLQSVLMTTNLGNCPVVFTYSTVDGVRIYGEEGDPYNELLIIQNNPASSLVFQSKIYERTAGTGTVSKIGPGTMEVQTNCSWSASTLLYGGTILIDGYGTVGTAPMTVFSGANFEGATGATNSAPVTVLSGGSNSVYVSAANGQFFNGANLTFDAGTTWLAFNYSNTIGFSATAPLLVTNGTLTASNTVNIAVNSTSFSLGQFPLVRYSPSTPLNLGTNTFANVFNLYSVAPGVTASLVNDTASNSIDLLVTAIDQSIHWAVGNGTWDIGVSTNWANAASVPKTYLQSGGLGNIAVFSDAAAGPSPIDITLNVPVTPAAMTNNSSAINYSISGTGSINGPGGFAKSGTGTLTLSTANGFTGGFALNGGIVNFAALDNLGTGILAFNGGTLQYAGGNTSDISTLTSVFAAGGATIDTGGNNVSFANPIAGGSVGNFTKAGAGSLTLNGTNTYFGATLVEEGALDLGTNAALPDSPAIMVNSGAVFDVTALAYGTVTNFTLGASANQTLGGTGTVNGEIVTGSGATITPGNSGGYGTLSFGNDLVVSNGILDLDVSTTNSDLISVAGNLTCLAGTVQLNISGILTNGTYRLFHYGESLVSGAGSSANMTLLGFNQAGQVGYLSDTLHPKEVDLVVIAGATNTEVWQGNNPLNPSAWDLAVTPNWLNGNTAAVFLDGDTVVFNDTAQNATVTLAQGIYPSAVTVNNSIWNYVFTDGTGSGGGKLIGPTALAKSGSANLTLLTANLNYGGTSIDGGTVQIGNGGSTGDLGSGNITNNGILIYDQPDSRSVPGVISGSGSLTQQGNGTLTLANNNTYSGGTTISGGTLQIGVGGPAGGIGTGPITDNTALIFDVSSALPLNQAISGSGTFTMAGPGSVTLSASNSYYGTTYISKGTVNVGAPTAIPSGSGFGNVELDAASSGTAGVLNMNGFDVAVNGLVGAVGNVSGMIANNSGSATNTLTIGVGGPNTTTYSGQIADNTGAGGKVALLVEGGVTQTLDIESPNTFSGGTIISNATINLTSVNQYFPANSVALGTGPVTLYNGTLDLVGSSGTTTPTYSPAMTNTVTVPAGYTGAVAGDARDAQTGGFNPLLLGSGTFSYITAYVRGNIGGNWSGFTGQIDFAGAANGGQIGISTTNGFNKVYCFTTNGGSAVVLYNTVAGTPTISFAELADDGTTTIEAGTSGNGGGVAAIFSVGSANTSTNFGLSILDAVGIAKVGTGTWTNTCTTLTYTGSTAVSNGVLMFVSNAPTASTPIIIEAPGIMDVSAVGGLLLTTNQTVEGNGTILGLLNVGSLALLEPGGASIGTLTVTNSVTISGTNQMKLNTTNAQTSDLLASPVITVEPGAVLIVTNIGPTNFAYGQTFQLFSTPISAPFTTLTLPSFTGDSCGTLAWVTSGLTVNGTISVGGTSCVNTTPTNILYQVSENLLTLSWPTDHIGWQLQAQTNDAGITTNWVTIPGSASTNEITLPIGTNSCVFYRMIYTIP